jgi:hypothetical protein
MITKALTGGFMVMVDAVSRVEAIGEAMGVERGDARRRGVAGARDNHQ